jgi:hypothetical protein
VPRVAVPSPPKCQDTRYPISGIGDVPMETCVLKMKRTGSVDAVSFRTDVAQVWICYVAETQPLHHGSGSRVYCGMAG